MATDTDPIEGTWYCHLDKGQPFFVVAVDELERTVEVQHFDGDIEEFDFATWYRLDIEVCEEPENWSGPFDIDNIDDFGTEVTDTRGSDWNAPLNEFGTKRDLASED